LIATDIESHIIYSALFSTARLEMVWSLWNKKNIRKKRRAKEITFVLEKIITLSLIEIQSTMKIM